MPPSDLIRAIQRHGQPTVLARAIAELGRIDHTIALLRYLTDDVHRRLVLTMLSRNEARHALARQIFHGRRGDLYQPYRTGQENHLGALGLVLNAIVLWNTRYLGAAVEHHRIHGGKVDVDDLAHVGPLVSHHLNLQGRYNFALPPQPAGQLRPLRHP